MCTALWIVAAGLLAVVDWFRTTLSVATIRQRRWLTGLLISP